VKGKRREKLQSPSLFKLFPLSKYFGVKTLSPFPPLLCGGAIT
jgi:hypothetical protein